MNLIDRIKTYLKKKNEWVSSSVIYTLARQHGYTERAVKDALEAISHTPPFATWYISPTDTHAKLTSGTYYRWYDMPAKDLTRIVNSLEYFD